ncbi:molecular chaperone DnaJ, partial [Salmonella enterica subsp. enterica serovar Sandiego]|nr:molecular chaperone DnaJ [Salmonella enterica subsp. enterica serovar Sandiego]
EPRLHIKEQPVPVVPAEMPKGLAGQIVSLLAHNIGDKLLAQKIWNACRAAMLQGAEPVSDRDELPVIGWLRSDYNSDDKRDPNAPLFMLGSNDPSDAWGVKYIPLSGNSPVIPGGWVMVPKKLTAENGAKSLLSGEFLETTFISCPECFADEECESCDGSGRIKIEVPVSWTTIKAIWNKGVEHFRSSTATGDN